MKLGDMTCLADIEVYFEPDRKTGGDFLTTGGFESFEALGNAVRQFFDRLLEATDRL